MAVGKHINMSRYNVSAEHRTGSRAVRQAARQRRSNMMLTPNRRQRRGGDEHGTGISLNVFRSCWHETYCQCVCLCVYAHLDVSIMCVYIGSQDVGVCPCCWRQNDIDCLRCIVDVCCVDRLRGMDLLQRNDRDAQKIIYTTVEYLRQHCRIRFSIGYEL